MSQYTTNRLMTDGFSTIQTPSGTYPVAGSPSDVLTLVSSDGSVSIVGNAVTDTIDIRVTSGFGVPAGGTANQALTKIDSTNYNTQWSTINKSFVGLGNVDNTSDMNKPISTATQNALNLKIDSDTALAYALMFG